MLYRVLPSLPGAGPLEEGGALFVPRLRQGSGRHDNPAQYGAIYASRDRESAVAEAIQGFRGQLLGDSDLVRGDGRRSALAAIDDSAVGTLVDLDDPADLVRRNIRPSRVATNVRDTTQLIALSIYQEGVPGFGWWSTLEASWANVTLFAERATPLLVPAGDPEPLTTDHPVLRAAADAVGVTLARRGSAR